MFAAAAVLILSSVLTTHGTAEVATVKQPGEMLQVPVFTSGQEGYHTYRIPALITMPSGTLLAFCEGRKTGGGDHGDLDMVLKRSTDGGRHWGPHELVYEEGGTEKITIGNPCPVVDQDTGILWLPFCRDNDDVFITHSRDEGRTWAKPERITSDVKLKGWGWYATGPGVGIQLQHAPHKGRLIIPCDHREPEGGKKPTMSHVLYSDDHGKSWQLGGTVGHHTNECQIVELAAGRLMMNMRNYWAREGARPERGAMRAVGYSTDGGATWGPLEFDKTLIEPLCQASLLSYDVPGTDRANATDPAPLLFSNPATKKKRRQMTLRVSHDEGQTWPHALLLQEGPAAYSCLTCLPGGDVGCLYERGEKKPYETITFARIPRSLLFPDETPQGE
jgi:sialidase-1